MAAIGQILKGIIMDRTLSSSSSSRIAGVASSPSPQKTLIGAGGMSGIAHRQLSISVKSIDINKDSRKVKVYAENGAFDLVSYICFLFVTFCISKCCELVSLGFDFSNYWDHCRE